MLGERYDTGQLSFFGWTSQKICYDQTAGFYSGVTRLGADIAEREALIWAALWRLQLDSSIPTTFCYDCVSAGRFASGQQGAHEVTAQHAILRGLHQALHSAVGDRFLSYHHVKGHSACVWNDLADAAAKLCLRQVRFHRRQEFDLRKWTPIIPHLWLLFGTGNGLSSLPRWRCSSTSWSPGKTHYLQDQFATHGFVMVGIQEARTKEGLIVGKGPYYRLCSGHQGGHHGVELWISKTQPVGFIGSRPVLINRSDVTVLWKDPRRLLVHIETEVTALYVAVLHCPQSGQGVDTRESWWLETTELLSLHVDPMKLFVLGDFNATSGPTDGVVVFEADDVTSPNTDCFRASLEALQLCLPATALAHEGPFHTWVSPDGTIEKRINFIAIPQSFCHCVAASATLDDVDLGNGAHDHCAVGLSIQHSLHTRPVLRRRKRPQIDRAAIKHIDRNIISSAIASSSAPNWQQDIETDVAHFNATALQLLTTHCKPSAPEAKKPFFDEALWNLRTEKNSSRRTLKRVCKAYRSEVLRTYFNAWTLSQGSATMHASEHWNYRITLQCDSLLAAGQFYNKNFHTKQSLRIAKKTHVQQYVDQLHPGASATDILAGLRPCIGTSNMRKRKGTSLPHVLDAQGRPCRTQEETVNRWSAFFWALDWGPCQRATQGTRCPTGRTPHATGARTVPTQGQRWEGYRPWWHSFGVLSPSPRPGSKRNLPPGLEMIPTRTGGFGP